MNHRFADVQPPTSLRIPAGIGLTLALCVAAFGAVPAADVALVPIVSDNLPVFYSLTGYANKESRISPEIHQMPLFTPYDNLQPDWWDNLVAEQLHARMSVMMMATRGVVSLTNTNDFSGSMNPRQLVRLIDAFDRAGIDHTMMKVTCFVDTEPCKKHYQAIVGDSNALVDFSDRANVLATYWDHCIKPWFDTVPAEYWFRVKMGGVARPLIQFWSFHPSWASNMQGNISVMLTGIADRFQAEYGERPCFNMPSKLVASGNQDGTVAYQPDVFGFNNWFVPGTNESWTITTFNGRAIGHAVPAYAQADYYTPGSPTYLDPDHFISRQGRNGGGGNGDTLLEGLSAAMANHVEVMSIEGWTDDVEFAGMYRSLDSEWDNPNQYINLIRRHNDLRTQTLRLELEGCDAYNDNTPGNSGTKFRRSGDLDIQDKPDGVGWNIGWTAEGEWMEFRSIYLAPGTYTFPLNYASSGSKTVALSIDGVSLGDVVLPSSGGISIYDTHSLGTATVEGGQHDIRLGINSSGNLNLDWLFVKRTDISVSLKAKLNGKFATALDGGGDAVSANSATVGNFQKFIICDRNGGNLESGDSVNLQCHNGLFLSAISGGNKELLANRTANGNWEQFMILKAGGTGAIRTETDVVLKSSGGYFVNATGAGLLDLRGTAISTATTFTIRHDNTFESNDPPVAHPQSVTTPEITAKLITLTSSDANDDPVAFEIVSTPANGILSGVAPDLTYTPAANYSGPDSFTFRVNDGFVSSGVATVSIVVTPHVSPNLVLNPSFEVGGTAPDFWNRGGSAAGSPASFQDGAHSLGITTAGTNSPTTQTIPIQIGKVYQISVWINASGTTSGKAVFDTSDKYDGAGQGQFVMNSANAGWTKYSGKFTATTASVTLRMFTEGTFAGTVFFDNIVLTEVPPVTFDSWISGHFQGSPDTAVIGFGADPDNDGLANGLEFVLGGNPSINDAADIMPSGGRNGANYIFIYKRSDASEAGTNQIVQYGNNPGDWTNVSIAATGGSTGSAAYTVAEGTPASDPDTVTVTIPHGGADGFFVRLKVIQP